MSSLTYKDAGVDIDRADRAKVRIREAVRSTFGAQVLQDIGGFGGIYTLEGKSPHGVLVASIDSVGTKVKLAFMTGIHNTVGIDLVAHCVNDILACGAKPLFFLDYLGLGAVDEDRVAQVVEGLAEGCRREGCGWDNECRAR